MVYRILDENTQENRRNDHVIILLEFLTKQISFVLKADLEVFTLQAFNSSH